MVAKTRKKLHMTYQKDCILPEELMDRLLPMDL